MATSKDPPAPTPKATAEAEPDTDLDLWFGPLPESYGFPPVSVGHDSAHSDYCCDQQPDQMEDSLSHDLDKIQPLDLDSMATTTFAYRMIFKNRLDADDLEPGGRFNKEPWPPLFITGALQLPGTLSYVLGAKSAMSMQPSMFPALRIIPGSISIYGTLVLGRGGRTRKSLSKWHGKHYKRAVASVEVTLGDGAIRTLSAICWEDTKANDDSEGWTDQEDTNQGAEEMTPTKFAHRGDRSDLHDSLGDGNGDGRPWVWEDGDHSIDW